jgi:hypothetical protein
MKLGHFRFWHFSDMEAARRMSVLRGKPEVGVGQIDFRFATADILRSRGLRIFGGAPNFRRI